MSWGLEGPLYLGLFLITRCIQAAPHKCFLDTMVKRCDSEAGRERGGKGLRRRGGDSREAQASVGDSSGAAGSPKPQPPGTAEEGNVKPKH